MPSKFSPPPPPPPPASPHYCCPPPPHRTILPASPRGSPRDNRRNKRHRHRGSPRGEHPFRAMQPEKSQPAASHIQTGPNWHDSSPLANISLIYISGE